MNRIDFAQRVAAVFGPRYGPLLREDTEEVLMAKPGRKIKKANHGKRPANSKMRKQKRQRVKT